MGGILAIDWGDRKSGLATADALRISLQPLPTFRGPGDGPALLEHLAATLAERDVEAILVGLPLDRDGGEGPRAEATRRFAERLQLRFPDLQVVLHDEHLTTKEAEALLHEAGHHGRALRERKDAWAALVLLQDWILSGEPGAAGRRPGQS